MPTVNKNKQISGGALYSTDSDHILTTADQIYDELKGCYVNEYDFSGNVKSVNNLIPDNRGNVNTEIRFYFYKDNNQTKCKDSNGDDLTQEKLQELYTTLVGILDSDNKDLFKQYKFYYKDFGILLSVVKKSSYLELIFLNKENENLGRADYLKVTLDQSGSLATNKINANYIKEISIDDSNNLIVTNSENDSQSIPVPLVEFSLYENDGDLFTNGNLKACYNTPSANVLLNGYPLTYRKKMRWGDYYLVFKNVHYYNDDIREQSINVVIRLTLEGVASVVSAIPSIFYLKLNAANETYKVYSDYNYTEDITNSFRNYLFYSPDDVVNNSLNIFMVGYNTLAVEYHHLNNRVHLTFLSLDATDYKDIVLETANASSVEPGAYNYWVNESGSIEVLSNKVTEITKENKNSELLYPSLKALNPFEVSTNKVTKITEENKTNETLYPSVKALVDYIDSQNPLETALEAENLEQFLIAAKTISENTSSTQRYRLKIKGVIDFANPSNKDKTATIKWGTNDDDTNKYITVYDEAERCWNFEGIFMYTVIQGDSSNATLKTTYTKNGVIDTVSIKSYNAVFENIIIGGSAVSDDSSGKIHSWSRPLFIGTNNIFFKFTNCKFPILGHMSDNPTDTSKHCLLIQTKTDLISHEGSGDFKFFHTSLRFINCLWSPGRNMAGKAEGNLANAQIILDFSNNSSTAYNSTTKTRNLEILANTKIPRFSESGDNVDYDLPEIGIPQFYIKGNDEETWAVSSDAHALVKSDNKATVRYFATLQVQDVFFKQAVYTKTSDSSFNTDYQLVKYIQDLENRIKTLETRLNTN